MLVEDSCTFYGREIILLDIVLSRSSKAENIQSVLHSDFGKVRQAKIIRSTQVYEKL